LEATALVEQYLESGLTQRVFARRHGIGVSTLQLWLRQFREGKRPGSKRTPRQSSSQRSRHSPEIALLEVDLSEAGVSPAGNPAPSPGYEIELASRGRLRVPPGFCDEEVRRLLRLLGEVR
jgi:transposase-like protein